MPRSTQSLTSCTANTGSPTAAATNRMTASTDSNAASVATSAKNAGYSGKFFANSISWNFNLGLTAASADPERKLWAFGSASRVVVRDGVVAEAQDIDLCMIMGAGWPFWLGGITPYLDRSGASERAGGGRFLPQGLASVPA